MKKTRLWSLVLVVALIVGLFAGIPAFAESAELRTVKILAPLLRPNSVHGLEHREEYPAYQLMSQQLAERGLALDFEAVVNEQFEVVLNTRLASGSDLPDIIAMQNYITDATAVTYGENGLFLDIVEAFNTYDEDGSIFEFWSTEFPDVFGFLSTEGGKIYWVPYMYKSKFVTGEEYCGTGFTTSIRKDWMDALGLEWNVTMTADEVYEALVAFREKDANGNGVADEIVDVELDGFQNGIAQAFGVPCQYSPYQLASITTRSDTVLCPWYADGITDYINYMKKLAEADLFDMSMIGTSRDDIGTQMRVANKVGMVYSYIAQTWLENDVSGVDGVEYAPMFITKAEGDEDFIVVREGVTMGYTGKWVITNNCKDVQAAVDLFDYIFTYDYATLMGFGIEGMSFEYMEDGTKRQLYRYAEISDDPDFRDCWPSLFMGQALPELGVSEFSLDRVLRETTYSGNPYETKDAAATWMFDNNKTMWGQHNTPPLAMITAAETETLNQYETILTTYSKELLVDLILGNRPVENLSDYIAEMQSLGLDEYLAVFQARHDRFLEATGG